MTNVFKLLQQIAEKNKGNPRFQKLMEYGENPPIQPGAICRFSKSS